MVFNSFQFLLFILLFFPSYWLINNTLSVKWRNLLLILASYVFYGWWDWRFLSLILISSVSDFVIAGLIESAQDQKRKAKLLLGLSIGINLGILGFFKYFNFFIDSLNSILESAHLAPSGVSLSVILPVGISFYTFQTMSYSIDVYRRKTKASNDPLSFFAFVAFFPQLVAGPIERASHLLPQFKSKKIFNYERTVAGLRLSLWGLFKKLVIADNLSVIADAVFAQDSYNAWITLLGALAFALQIYADFSAYSDMAIGLAKTLGFDLRENFRTPYFSRSFQEFWTRWHISLSSWFKDYVYIPLGGSQRSISRNIFTLLITFLLSGLWHGAHVNFLTWGLLHGIVLLLERHFARIKEFTLYPYAVFLLTVLFWIPFRAESSSQWLAMTTSLGDWSQFNNMNSIIALIAPMKWALLLPTIVLAFILEFRYRLTGISAAMQAWSKSKRWMFYYILAVLILLLTNLNVKPHFIYFQF